MKLTKQMYYTASGEKKLNCYKVNIPKAVAERVGIDSETEIKLKTMPGMIVIVKGKENEGT